MATLVKLQQAARLSPLSNAAGTAPSRARCTLLASCSCVTGRSNEDNSGLSVNRRLVLLAGPGFVLTVASAGTADRFPAAEGPVAGRIYSEWEEVAVPVHPEVELLDVKFVPRHWDHGYLVGTTETLLETWDGGRSWSRCELPDGLPAQVTFTCVRFEGGDGWIIGQPSVLLHTQDGGSNWKVVPFRLNGSEQPIYIEALGEGQAELVTTGGAVLVTADGGLTWSPSASQSQAQASTDGRSAASTDEVVELSEVERSRYGDYAAVSSDGSAFLTWTRDQPRWRAHKKPCSANIKHIGWLSDGSLWVLSGSGGLCFSTGQKEFQNFQESKASIEGVGVRSVSFRSRYEVWAAGSGGVLLYTLDGGETWIRDLVKQNFTNNLSRIRFVNSGDGFMMGTGGFLFRHLAYGRSPEYIDGQSLRPIRFASQELEDYGSTQS